MTLDFTVRFLLVMLNVFVGVYAVVSAFRMRYAGSVLGRVALGVYAVSVTLQQALLIHLPLTPETWVSVFSTAVGLAWFVVEVYDARRHGRVR